MILTDAQKVEVGLQPPPGIYVNVPAADYFRWPYLSKSALSDFAKSPALWHGRATGNIPWKSSAAFTIGSAVDLMWVEQRPLDDGFRKAPAELPSRGKKRDKWVAELPAGTEPITNDQATKARAMRKALLGNKRAMELRECSQPQVSVVWRCPFTGLMLKGRPDLVAFEQLILSDLKSTRNIRPWAFDGDFGDYNYHWQLHLYTQGLVANGCGRYEDWRHWLITMANDKPHGVACRPVPRDPLELAVAECAHYLAKWRECRINNHWPADLLDEKPVALPGWRYKFTGRTDG